MKIAVVILNWNGRNLLKHFLPSIVNYSDNAEIIVADNASTDDSVKWVKENYPDVRIIQNTENGGYARGYNQALKHVDADVYALVNSDIEVTKNWLSSIEELFKSNKDISIIQPKILDFKNIKKFEFAGATGGFIDKLGYPYCRGRVFTEIEEDKGQYNDVSEIFWASGACFFIKSETFIEVGGFDEDYFAHMEEIDLCWRAHNLGKKVFYTPYSKVYHVGGATLQESNPHKTYLNFRNSLFTILKNAPFNEVPMLILSRLILDGVAGMKFVLQGNVKHTFAIIRAHFSFYKHMKKMLDKRDPRATFSNNYYIHKSVVFQFYILGHKLFTKLK
ncbi:MAG: glycosyltransferase family 2 protein [Flavobacteriales bacterium]|nr:glycosyltransferase family 2 protein [Flavobacteriales bacterium]